MQHLSNIYRLGIKELRGLWHDKVLFLIIIWAFSAGIYTKAIAISSGLHNAPIAFVDEDRSPLSGSIINAFYKPYFKTPEFIVLSDIDPGLDPGIYTFVVDIPPNFERDVLAGKQPDIQVNIDATRMTQAMIGAGYIQNIINGKLMEFVQSSRSGAVLPIELATRVKFNPNLTSTWFSGVMELINIITMLSIILTGAALGREREQGTLEHLLVRPLGAAEIMLAKVWSMGLVVLAAAGLSLYFIVQGLLSVPIAGSIQLFMFRALLHLYSTASMGIFLDTVSRNMPHLGLLTILVLLTLQLFSVAVTLPAIMPDTA